MDGLERFRETTSVGSENGGDRGTRTRITHGRTEDSRCKTSTKEGVPGRGSEKSDLTRVRRDLRTLCRLGVVRILLFLFLWSGG